MRSRLRIALSLLVVSALGATFVLPGCGSTTPSDDCQAYFVAICDRTFACAPELTLDRGFATDPDTCAQRFGLLCPTLLDLPNTNLSNGYLGLCASDLAGATCDEWLNLSYTQNACDAALRGNEPPEHTCVDDFQCQSGVCIWPSSTTGSFQCGQCARLRIAGQSCTDSSDVCDFGLACNDGTCGTPKDVGERCSDIESCAYSLICDHGHCAPPRSPGASCSSDAQCNYAFGEVCDADSHTCGAPHPPYDGGECFQARSTEYLYCSPGFYCNVVPSRLKPGYCEPTFADGTSCTVTAQDPCTPPATCNGTCTLPTPATCH